nr:acyl--CoA ligase [Pseudomonas sp.]
MSKRPTLAENPLIGDWLDAYASAFPDRPALEFRGVTMSWQDMQARVDQCARAYVALGIQRGERIGFLCTPRPEAFISFLAAARIGALWVGLNPKYQHRELAYVVNDAKPRLLIGLRAVEGREHAAELQALADSEPTVENVVVIDDDAQAADGLFAWAENTGAKVDAQAWAAARQHVQQTDPAMLVYTSGSSGSPKGVLLRQRELLRRSVTQNTRFPVQTYPVVINPLPINHIGGMHFLSLFTFVGGGCIRFQEKLAPAEIVQAMRDQSINMLYVVPMIFKLIVDEPEFEPRLLDNIEWFVFSGAAMATELIDMVKAARCKVGLTYGMTETCGSVTYADLDADTEVLAN